MPKVKPKTPSVLKMQLFLKIAPKPSGRYGKTTDSVNDYKNIKTNTMAKLNFGGVTENVVTRDEFPLSKAQEVLKNETVAVIGYGVQGPGQSLNQRDNGINVIVGQRKNSKSWDKAVADGFVPGKTLFEIEDALQRGTIICYLLSDAAQIALWPTVKEYLTPGKALYFSHGFGITFNEQTGIIPPKDVDVFLVAPKGSGTSLRRMFLQGRGLNSSYAIYQDATGRAFERVIALGIAVGSGYLFETDFKKEVFSDLTGERGTLMGAIQGIFAAQYQVLRERGHSPSEAFNETVEELTQSLMPLVAENGMDWMYANCSTTAQRGALDWWKRFRDVTLPVFNELYDSVAAGNESRRSIESNSQPDYREKLGAELKELRESELWQAGKTVRSLRPENQTPASKGEEKKSSKLETVN
jgi:ketol-acid reductoisomerase